MPWNQVYDPLHHRGLSTLVAALPLAVLLGLLAWRRVRAHYAALAGLATALLVALAAIRMPAGMAARAAAFGAAYGLFPIGWIVLNVLFLYQLAEGRGLLVELRDAVTGITRDRRLQLLLIAFCLGAFFEGAAGFGTPVAVTGALLIGLGFPPLEASGLSLIVPFWLVTAYAGLAGMLEVWPALLLAGLGFAVPQLLVSNLHGPWLVDIVASVASIAALTVFLRYWRPARAWEPEGSQSRGDPPPSATRPRAPHLRAWLPWIVLSVLVFAWGLPQTKDALNHLSAPQIAVGGLDRLVLRAPPVVVAPTAEGAVFSLNWLSATGTAILLAAIASGLLLRYPPRDMARAYLRTIRVVRHALLTIAAMMALGFTTRYSGQDAILGLAFARTGVFYPFFGAMLGWLGVALTGSDTSSNVLFGSLQTITARQVGLSPVLMAAANSTGGVMGKMIDAQSIVVASAATRWYGHEWRILRYVFLHSLALAALVGFLVLLQAYVPPFTGLVPR